MVSAAARKKLANPRDEAGTALRFSNRNAEEANAIEASTHQAGGRQTYLPIQSPAAKAEAAQNSGCRAEIWMCGLEEAAKTMAALTSEHQCANVNQRASISERQSADKVKDAFQVISLRKQINHVGFANLIAQR